MASQSTNLLQRPFDLVICIFYGIQIPIALLLDSQAVIPKDWFPEGALTLNDWYIQRHQDPLVSAKPNWFVGCGYFELFVQVPFFIVAVFSYALGQEFILLPNLVFSSASTALMIPIISELLLCTQKFDRWTVLAFYAPFVVMPFLIAVKTYMRIQSRMGQTGASHTKRA